MTSIPEPTRADPPASSPAAQYPPVSIEPGRFNADLQSFKQYKYPDWFRDAKLGIWSHWGPQSVPMEGDWYARQMYEQGSRDYNDHLARFGHPSKAGYKDIIPLWKAEKWDPDGLMELYKKAGARYFVAQAVHHDNFDNWNSKYHSWNSVNMGPHRDMVGDWRKAALKQGLRFGVSEHLGASFTWFQGSHGSDKTGPFAGVPYDGSDPRWAELYHLPTAPGDNKWYTNDPRSQLEWFSRIKDLIDNYHPDLLYSDGGVPFGNDVGRSLIAHLYNSSATRNSGTADAVYNCKETPNGMWVEDVERGSKAGISAEPWQADTSIGDWFYNKHWKYRNSEWIIHSLVDTVSKNGDLLINVVQRPDGTLDDEARKIVDELAAWIAVNGDGIYGTRPWLVYGEGKRKTTGGMFNENHNYGADDIRFTCKGDTTIYAFALGWPEGHAMTIHSLAALPGVTAKINRVSLMGNAGPLEWNQTADGLVVHLPETRPCESAIGLKIDGEDLLGFKPELAIFKAQALHANATGSFQLSAEDAELNGGLKLETHDGVSNIGYWDNAADTANWKAAVDRSGKFKVTASYGAIDDTTVNLESGDQKITSSFPGTGGWDKFKEIELGEISLAHPGDRPITLRAAPNRAWKPINLRWIKLTKLP